MANENKIKWFDVIDSTNTKIMTEKSELCDKSTYAALFQTAGKGQRGNRWESGSGENLTFSILFKPEKISASKQFIISEIVTIGIVNYLNSNGLNAKIKWPNDIYTGDMKICGILIENIINNDILSESVVGIGLNVNQEVFRSDAPNPTSLYIQTGIKREIRDELCHLLDEIFTFYDKISSSEELYHHIEEHYISLLYRKGEKHRYIECTEGREIEGEITGIDKTARLLLKLSDGSIKSFAFKEIKYII